MSDTGSIIEEETAEKFDPVSIKALTIRKVYEYWLGKCGDAQLPNAGDIDILDLDYAVGALSLVEVVDQSPRFYLSMIGSEVVTRHGIDNTGLFVDEIEDEASRSMLLSSYTRSFANREPFWIERKTYSDDHLFVYECLILPLANDQGEVVRLMTVLYWPEESFHRPWERPQ